jgi:hypothetical protein
MSKIQKTFELLGKFVRQGNSVKFAKFPKPQQYIILKKNHLKKTNHYTYNGTLATNGYCKYFRTNY